MVTSHDDEILSALVDGELQGETLEYALNLLAINEEASMQFRRYQLISDVLHNYVTAHHHIDLAKRVSARLADEPALVRS